MQPLLGYHFYFNFMLTGHLYTQVMQILIFIGVYISIFTECCFWLWRRFEWSNSLLFRLSPSDQKSPPAKFPITSSLLTLFGKPWPFSYSIMDTWLQILSPLPCFRQYSQYQSLKYSAYNGQDRTKVFP